ncbi:hypothetical protein [Sphingomonas sp. IW22]|uniref:hypothetical protein n=1 Tax=Sphingomonas sp. IW22 TaxID=3242489 RepID=UPI0035221643
MAHTANAAFVPMNSADLAETHRTGCHCAIRQHLAARVKTHGGCGLTVAKMAIR